MHRWWCKLAYLTPPRPPAIFICPRAELITVSDAAIFVLCRAFNFVLCTLCNVVPGRCIKTQTPLAPFWRSTACFLGSNKVKWLTAVAYGFLLCVKHFCTLQEPVACSQASKPAFYGSQYSSRAVPGREHFLVSTKDKGNCSFPKQTYKGCGHVLPT